MRLELTRRGDYAVRAMLALASRRVGAPMSVRAIATTMDIPAAFLPRVMGELARAGLVASRTGRKGGYALARPPAAITLLEVIEAVEGDARRQACVLRGGPCGRDGYCQVHGVFLSAQQALLDRLDGASLADVPSLDPSLDDGSAGPERGADRSGPADNVPNGPIRSSPVP